MVKKISSGLTIMELVIVLAVLGILVGIAFPSIPRFSAGYKLRGAAREVATDLQFARLLAVKENQSYKVIITGQSYQVMRTADNFVAKARDFSTDYPEVSLSTLTVAFDSRGTSNPSTISISYPLGGTKTITVGTTGRVKLG